MARKTEMDPSDQTKPLWVRQARQVLGVTADAEVAGISGPERARLVQEKVGIDDRLAKRVVRALRFVEARFPEALAQYLGASWASVLELERLYRFDESEARDVSARVFSGALPYAEVSELAKAAARRRPSRRELDREWAARFSESALKQIEADPKVLGLGAVDKLLVPPRGELLMPDLLVQHNGQLIAVEIKSCGETTAKHQVGGFLARIAQLEQRYTRAILVIPKVAGRVGEMARSLQRGWDGREVNVVCL